jgi:hypothetical protein
MACPSGYAKDYSHSRAADRAAMARFWPARSGGSPQRSGTSAVEAKPDGRQTKPLRLSLHFDDSCFLDHHYKSEPFV